LGESGRGFDGVILRYFPAETEENIQAALLSIEHGSENILWRGAGSRPARGKITASGIRGCIHYCKIVIVYIVHNLQI